MALYIQPGSTLDKLAGEISDLESDNARLRALVKRAEEEGSASRCPWCNAWVQNKEHPHYDECQAFTPNGDVR